jgi:hypothetical protein
LIHFPRLLIVKRSIMLTTVKKTIFIGGVACLTTLLSSMSGCHPCGGGDYNPAFRITRVDAVPLYYNNNLPEERKADSVGIQNDSVLFRADLIAQNVVNVKPRSGFSFFPEAVACSPVEPYYVHNIDSVDIIALDNWDATHPAGSSLADIARAKDLFMMNGWAKDTSFLAWKAQLQDIRYGRQLTFNGGAMVRMKAPQQPGARFYFLLRWSDPQNQAQVVELRSQPLRVVK